MGLTALPTSADIYFVNASGENKPLALSDPPAELYSLMPQLLQKMKKQFFLKDSLFIEMANYGNFLDIKAQLKLFADQKAAYAQGWIDVATKILRVEQSDVFHYNRIYVMQNPFVEQNGVSRSQAIAAIKQTLGLPDAINFDILSYKIPPRGSAYFCMKNPQILEQMTNANVAVLDQIDKVIKNTLKEKFAIQRQLEKSIPDDNISDYQVYLESVIAGRDTYKRSQTIANLGDAELISHVTTSAQAFAQGIIPGAISPSKISACQDAVSMIELTNAIMSIAEQQIYQIGNMMSNPAARYAIKKGGEEMASQSRWRPAQAASIHNAASITEQTLRASLKSFSHDPYTPALDNKIQAEGGPNDLHDEMQMAQHRRVVQMTPVEQEILNQTLSVMLACLRVRFDATQQARGEMVAQEDIDHFDVLERLAPYADVNASAFYTKAAKALKMAAAGGHNESILQGFGPSPQALTMAIASARGAAQELAKTIGIMAQDIQTGGALFESYFESAIISLADKNRLSREARLKYAKKAVIMKGYTNRPEDDILDAGPEQPIPPAIADEAIPQAQAQEVIEQQKQSEVLLDT